MRNHIGHDLIERFVAGTLGDRDALEFLWHLHTCSVCKHRAPTAVRRAAAQTFGADPLERISFQRYRKVIRRVLTRIGGGLRADDKAGDVPSTIDELLLEKPARRSLLLRNHPRFRRLEVAEELLVRCRGLWSDQPLEAEQLAELSLVCLDRAEDHFLPALVADLRGRAFSFVANCQRIQDRLPQALESFAAAEEWLAKGTGDVLERASLTYLRGAYLRLVGDLAEAATQIDEALRIVREAGDEPLEARYAIGQASLLFESEKTSEAIGVLERAAFLAERNELEDLLLGTHSNLAVMHLCLGAFNVARSHLARAKALARRFGGRLDHLRVLWTEADIEAKAGNLRGAETIYLRVRHGFLAEDLGIDAALVTLDLAGHYLVHGETIQAKRLAEDMLPIFASHDIQREAIAALLLYKEAAEREQATLALVQEVTARLRRCTRTGECQTPDHS